MILVRAGAGDPVAAHLVDELVALGITVEIVPAGDTDLATLGRARSARAVLRVTPSRQKMELWVEGADAMEPVEEQPDERGDAAALALRAVESLRGRLLAVEKAEKPTPPVQEPIPAKPPVRDEPPPPRLLPSPTPPPPAPSPPRAVPRAVRPTRLSLQIEPAALLQPRSGGISVAWAAFVGARWKVLPRLGADLVVLVPVVPATLESPDGRVQLAVAAALAGGSVELLDPAGPLGMAVGAGLGAGMVSHFGQPGTGRVEARDGSVPFALPYARWGLVWRASRGVGLSADVLGAMATPRPVIRLPGRTTDAYFGQPLLSLSLGIAVSLW